MNTSELVEWQRIDPSCGLVEPWLTHNFMDEAAKTWPLKTFKALEFGAGRSTAWWRYHCRWVDTIEANAAWAKQAYEDCMAAKLENGGIYWAPIPDGIPEAYKNYFGLIPEDQPYHHHEEWNLIIVDGLYRTEIMEWAVEYFELSAKGGILVADNFEQDFVWISPRAVEAVKNYEQHRFVQPGHTNHEGRPWNTSYWKIKPNK